MPGMAINPACCLSSVILQNGYVDGGALFPPGDEFWLLQTAHTPDECLSAARAG